MDNATTVTYAGLIHQLTSKAKCTVRDIDPQVSGSTLRSLHTHNILYYCMLNVLYMYLHMSILNAITNGTSKMYTHGETAIN